MTDFIIAYRSGKMPDSPEEGAQQKARWDAWVTDLGDAVVNPGTPLGPPKIVGTDGAVEDGGANTLVGFTVVSAADMDAALEIAKACPYLEMGAVQVSQVMAM